MNDLEIARKQINDYHFMFTNRTKNTYFTKNTGKMSFTETMYFILKGLRKTLQIEIDDRFEFLGGDNTMTKQGFSQLRQKIKPDAFMKLNDNYISWFYNDDNYKKYKGYSLAEDAVQESFIRIINNFDKFNKNCPQTRNKFVNIGRTVSIDIYRKREKQNDISYDEIEKSIIDEFAVTDDILDSMEFERYLFKLPQSYFIILSLKYGDGYSYKEIAGILDLTEENVKKRLMRARKKLREIINEQEAEI